MYIIPYHPISSPIKIIEHVKIHDIFDHSFISQAHRLFPPPTDFCVCHHLLFHTETLHSIAGIGTSAMEAAAKFKCCN